MSELAVVSAKRAKLQARVTRGDKGAAVALKLAENPTRILSGMQVGITLIGIFMGAYGEKTISQALHAPLRGLGMPEAYTEGVATAIVVVALTYFSLVIGELAPKRVALMFPETLASRTAGFVAFTTRAFTPAVAVLTYSTSGILRVLGVKDGQGHLVTHEEVEAVLAEGTSAGLIEPEEQAMIGEVLRLGDRPVRVAMTPRRDVYWISLNDPEDQQRAEVRACPHSRMVVAEGDDVDEPVGVVHKKDLLDAVLDGGQLNVAERMVTPIYVPNSASVLKALEMLKQTSVHMALVVDEFGALEGIVTALDLLEMIAGDFPEGHDDAPSHAIVERDDGSFLVDGRADIDALAAALGADLGEPGSFHTAAGLVLQKLGRLPHEGEVAEVAGWRVEVIDMDERRIDKLLFVRTGSGASLEE